MGNLEKFIARARNFATRRAAGIRTIIRTAEFALVLGMAGLAASFGGDMSLIIPALVGGVVIALLGIVTAPSTEMGRRLKIFLSLGVVAVFAGEGVFLDQHFHPAGPAPPATNPSAGAPIPPPILLPDHPPEVKAERIAPQPGPQKREFVIDNSTLQDPSKKSIVEQRPDEKDKTIARSNNQEPPNVLSVYMLDVSETEGLNVNALMDFNINVQPPSTFRVFYTILNNFQSNIRYLAFYVQNSEYSLAMIDFLAANYPLFIVDFDKQMGIGTDVAGLTGEVESWHLRFSGRVVVYTEEELTADQQAHFVQAFKAHGADVQFRSANYAESIWANIKLGVVKPIPLYELRGTPPLISPVHLPPTNPPAATHRVPMRQGTPKRTSPQTFP